MTDREEVIKFMSKIKGRTPILLIGKSARIFRNIYSGRIYNLKNEDDMQDIYNMNISKITKAVVLDDLSQLYNDENLLKLIEESTLQLILLASKDNLSEVLMSRCKSILKLPELAIEKCKYIKENSALSSVNSMTNLEEAEVFICNNCPQLLYDKNRTKQFKYRDRIVNILANINSKEVE